MNAPSYGIYIHIPFCRSKCKYCAFASIVDLSLQRDYVRALVEEIETAPERGGKVDTVYIGGGTPSCLYDGGLTEIFKALKDSFVIARNAEITVECNPESVDEAFVGECVSSGVNRISMGLQSSSDGVLEAVGRTHGFEQYLSALNLLSHSFDNISSDIILGLPKQDKSDVSRSVDVFAEYCKHVSVYALTVEEGTPLFRDGYSPDDDAVADLYDFARDMLKARGFERYEVSNFAKRGCESRHNIKYWECKPYIGLGVAAHGYDGEFMRYKHTESVKEYIEDRARQCYGISEKDRFNEYVMLRLRTERGIDFCDFENRFGKDFRKLSSDKIDELASSGQIITDGDGVRIAPDYMFVMNGIIEQFMAD